MTWMFFSLSDCFKKSETTFLILLLSIQFYSPKIWFKVHYRKLSWKIISNFLHYPLRSKEKNGGKSRVISCRGAWAWSGWFSFSTQQWAADIWPHGPVLDICLPLELILCNSLETENWICMVLFMWNITELLRMLVLSAKLWFKARILPIPPTKSGVCRHFWPGPLLSHFWKTKTKLCI